MITHKKVSSKADPSDTSLIRPSDWNDIHVEKTGRVQYVHDSVGNFAGYKEDGSAIDLTGTTTEGLQESLNYAQLRALDFEAFGGGVTPPVTGLPGPSQALSRVRCTTPIAFKTGWGNHYDFYGMDIFYDVLGGADPDQDCISVDSSDYTKINFWDSQIINPGNKYGFRFNPTKTNGEDFAGFTSSNFQLPTIAVVDKTTLAPQSVHGGGVRISAPALGLGLGSGNGIFINNVVTIAEINGGLIGLLLDDPGDFNSPIRNCTFGLPGMHRQGTVAVKIGVTVAGIQIYSNKFEINNTSDYGVEIWGKNNIVELIQTGGITGITRKTTSSKNLFVVNLNSLSGTTIVDSSTNHDDVVVGIS